MRRVAGTVLLALLAAAPARSQPLSYVGVYPDESRSTCVHTGHPTMISQAHVFVTNSLPLKEISFSAPMPSCLGGYLAESSPFATTGNSQSGVTIDLGSCTTAPVKVMTIFYIAAANDACCAWLTAAHPSSASGQIEFVDCDDVTRHGESTIRKPIWTCCYSFDVLSPYQPFPADGATGVSTEVDLTWLVPDQRCDEFFFLGTYPPGHFQDWTRDLDEYTTGYDPGTLQPNTTYYWAVSLACGIDIGVRSPIWTFTTGAGPVTVTSSTWGAVKALYRP
jgi:hypothetical protein